MDAKETFWAAMRERYAGGKTFEFDGEFAYEPERTDGPAPTTEPERFVPEAGELEMVFIPKDVVCGRDVIVERLSSGPPLEALEDIEFSVDGLLEWDRTWAEQFRQRARDVEPRVTYERQRAGWTGPAGSEAKVGIQDMSGDDL